MSDPDDAVADNAVQGYLGHRIHGARGDTLGHVVDILADARSGVPHWLVIRVAGLRRSHRAAPISLCLASRGRLVMPVTRQALLEGPLVRPRTALTAAEELALRVHWSAQ